MEESHGESRRPGGVDPRAQLGLRWTGRFENRGDRDSYWPYVAGTPGLYGFPGLLPFGGFPYPVPYPGSDGGVRDFGGVRSRGSFAGRGPRGYRRSDDRMREDLNEHLTRHAFIDASDIEVTVEDGIATLRGIVADRDQKHLAEDVAAGVFGVRDVDNDLKVRHGFPRWVRLRRFGFSFATTSPMRARAS